MIDISHLNDAQKKAVTAPYGPMLIIAGAGSGKTRTIVYRLAWLAGQGVDPQSMLLLTFTRKASQQMLSRAADLLGRHVFGVQGGTFHSFAFSVLRRWTPAWIHGNISVMDTADSASAIQACKESLSLGKGDRSFPRTQAVLSLLSKARNKEITLEELLSREAQHLLPHAQDMVKLQEAYTAYKHEHGLLDYDDLLFELEQLFIDEPNVLEAQKMRFGQIMVDEYQDTNKVQARLTRMLAGEDGNIMAVGDDAQSIYAFRGAAVYNILNFPKLFRNTRIIRLEENYRSVQPILDVANSLLSHSTEGYRKHLFSRREIPAEAAVTLYRPLSDMSQALLAARRIEELLETVPAREIAVLFRSGYQSYQLELELNKRGIGFRKYGGLRYTEAAHVKDVMAFARLVNNPMDAPSFSRIAALSKGIGPKTAQKLFALSSSGNDAALKKASSRWADFQENIDLIASLRMESASPKEVINRILEHYRPKMEELFPEDWPRRLQGLEEMSAIADTYNDLPLFLADISLDSPEETPEDKEDESRITLSTVHSAKGLEWSAVLIIDLVEERFPSRHALVRPEDFEEERRLMYVACTRAKDTLDLFSPLSIYSRSSGMKDSASPSPFISELPPDMVEEIYENYGGSLAKRKVRSAQSTALFSASPRIFWHAGDQEAKNHADTWPPAEYDDAYPQSKKDNNADLEALREAESIENAEAFPKEKPVKKNLGFCRHKLFGRGKIVEEIPPDKYRVCFPGLGLKVILADYLTLEP